MLPDDGGGWIAFSRAVEGHCFPIDTILIFRLDHKLRRDYTHIPEQTKYSVPLGDIKSRVHFYLTSDNELTLVLHNRGLVPRYAGVVAVMVGRQVVDPQRAGEVDIVHGHT